MNCTCLYTLHYRGTSLILHMTLSLLVVRTAEPVTTGNSIMSYEALDPADVTRFFLCR